DKMDTIHEQLVTAIAQLATTPLPAKGEALPLRYVVPSDAPIELWDSGMPQSTMYRCGRLPRSTSIQRVHRCHKVSAFWFRAVLRHLLQHLWRRARNRSLQRRQVGGRNGISIGTRRQYDP